jgi:transcriptional regulator with XRE-family HTH domain
MKKINTTEIEDYVINAVKEMRLQKGISQAGLAHLMDVSEGFIGNVESANYRAKYNINHLNVLAKIFECSPREFLPNTPL